MWTALVPRTVHVAGGAAPCFVVACRCRHGGWVNEQELEEPRAARRGRPGLAAAAHTFAGLAGAHDAKRLAGGVKAKQSKAACHTFAAPRRRRVLLLLLRRSLGPCCSPCRPGPAAFGEMGSDRGAVRGLWLAGVDLAASLSECHVAAPGPIETWTGRDGYCLLHESRPRLASELNNKKEGGGPISMQIIALPGSNHSEPSLEHCLLSSVDTMLQCCSLAWHERVHPCC